MRIIKTVSVVLLFFSQSMFCATIKFPSEKKLEKNYDQLVSVAYVIKCWL